MNIPDEFAYAGIGALIGCSITFILCWFLFIEPYRKITDNLIVSLDNVTTSLSHMIDGKMMLTKALARMCERKTIV